MRHRSGISATILVTLAAGLAGGRAPAAEERPVLRVLWIDVQGVAPYAFPLAVREAAGILDEVGINTSWTLGTPATETSGYAVSVVLLWEPQRGARLAPHTMGCTLRAGGSNVTWIYLSTVRWALGLQAPGGSAREQEEIGRALGRVVAHEIVHVLAPGLPHGNAGLMTAHLSRARLVRGRASLSPRDADALHAALGPFNAVK